MPRRVGNLSTIDDVARAAQVSTATVSRFINNPDVVAKATAARVRKAIDQLDYVPNALAGGLASSNAQFVTILIPFVASSVAEDMIDSLVERLQAKGIVTFIGVTGLNPERTHNVLMTALSRRATAIVTTGPIPPESRKVLERTNTTVIEMWGLPEEPLDVAIGFSHLEVGHALARFVHERGYRRPHLVTARGTRASRRKQGFLETWRGLGGRRPSEDEFDIPSHYGQAPEVVEKILAMPERPDIVVASGDELAHGIMTLAQAKGLKVPEDLAVIGFGGSAMSSLVSPSLATVRIDGRKIADRTLEVIEMRREGREPSARRIDCGFEIIARESI